MKILLIQERGRHEKNRNFRECENFKRAFDKLGIDSIIWGLNYDNYKITFDEIVKDRDIIISIENYDSGWVPNLSKYTNKLKLFWSIDSHCILNAHLKTVVDNKFDIVLNAIEHHQIYFQTFAKTLYFPNAYPDDLIFPKNNIEKKYEVGFCGSMIDNRQDWLNYLSTFFNVKKDIFVIGNDMVDALNSYKISFNKTIDDDINYRIFETMGCKTTLITNKPPGIEKFFEDEKHLIYYNNHHDLVEKIKYYLNNNNKLIEIAEKGFNEVVKNHTYNMRAKQIIEYLK